MGDVVISAAPIYHGANAVIPKSTHKIVSPGEVITSDPAFMGGHGTYMKGTEMIASISGVVEKVNKLISVRPLKSRYNPDVGDVVVGRITEVGQKRWKVDTNTRQDSILLLSSINLPGGVLRRRTSSDELQMRNFFVENDLISAEVQAHHGDGSISLHTRNLRYGKLENGVLVQVPPALVKRCKTHFVMLSCGVHMVLGTNGYIFLGDKPEDVDESMYDKGEGDIEAKPLKTVPVTLREKIARVRNSILALSAKFMAIHPTTIMDVYEAGEQFPVKDLIVPAVVEEITQTALARRMNDSMDGA
eukprot:TRINITY_DN1093_c0_g4_i1.p1 TRINITY_DN1093_c0_g4~~TRINITY_DN1093_c0_g4_i1.p1  ORF type:complete len:303 (-),score=62.15 TRINITY_DN1093_c0_g4_i1:99-1007(-)